MSVKSEIWHDARDQNESLRGRASRTKSGQISLNFVKNLGKICTLLIFYKVNMKKYKKEKSLTTSFQSGQISLIFGKFWKILGNICILLIFDKVNTKK